MNSGRISAHAATPIPQIRLYRDWLKQTRGLDFATYDDLHSWSVDDIEGFWRSIWDWEGIASPTRATGVLSGDDMPGARWFEGATVNYARHVFSHAEAAEAAGQPAIVAMDERGGSETIGWAELRRRAASLALELRERGIEPGDRVAGYLPQHTGCRGRPARLCGYRCRLDTVLAPTWAPMPCSTAGGRRSRRR